MRLYIEDTPIDAALTEAVATDSAGGQADSLRVTLADGRLLSQWDIRQGLRMELTEGGYTTGEMELCDVQTRMGGVTLGAVSLPYASRQEGWNCFENVTLFDLLKIGAKEMGLKGAKLYGVKGETVLRRVVRRGQTWPQFLAHVMMMEGAAVKLSGGYLLAIDYEAFFSGDGAQAILDEESRPNLTRMPKCRYMAVRTGLLTARAEDVDVSGNAGKTLTDEQIYSTEQAMRAARGLLMARNMESEVYTREIPLNTGLAAMSRVCVLGSGAGSGRWFVHKCAHDFVKRKTVLTLYRNITSIKI